MRMKKLFLVLVQLLLVSSLKAEDGYRLWLRYEKINNVQTLQRYNRIINSIQVLGNSPTVQAARYELLTGLSGLLGKKINEVKSNESVLVATADNSTPIKNGIPSADLKKIGEEGFIIKKLNQNKIVVTANTDMGLLYGVFHFLRLLQTNQNLDI